MAENNQLQPQNKVASLSKLISDQKSARALLELPQIEKLWVGNYEKVTGQKDGALRFNAEKILFLKRIEEDNSLKNSDMFSQYVAFSELAISGGTLRDGICYIVAFGKKAQFLPGYKFRLEQISELDSVVHCHQPQVVYDCDEFIYHKGMKVEIEKHVPGKRTKDSKITHVYFVVEFTFGPAVYIMEAIDVLRIRDQYSKSWKGWVEDCRKAKKNPELNESFQVEKNGYNGAYTATVEPPMWIKDEAEAFKKTVILRAWKAIPGKLKKAKHKFLDDRLKQSGINEDVDADDLKGMILESETEEIQQQESPKAENKQDQPGTGEKPSGKSKPKKQAEKTPEDDHVEFEDIPKQQDQQSAPAEDVNPYAGF